MFVLFILLSVFCLDCLATVPNASPFATVIAVQVLAFTLLQPLECLRQFADPPRFKILFLGLGILPTIRTLSQLERSPTLLRARPPRGPVGRTLQIVCQHYRAPLSEILRPLLGEFSLRLITDLPGDVPLFAALLGKQFPVSRCLFAYE